MFLVDNRSYLSYVNQFMEDGSETVIPLNDEYSYLVNQDYDTVYNRLVISKLQGLECYPVGVASPGGIDFPAFVKPVYNMLGMGIGAQKVKRKEFASLGYKHPGKFLMPFLEGKHLSVDMVLVNGKMSEYFVVEGFPDGPAKFSSWHLKQVASASMTNKLFENIKTIIDRYLYSYTGIVNFESIGDYVIECHLRPNTDIFPCYGPDYIKSIIQLYTRRKWNDVYFAERYFTFIPFFKKNSPLRFSNFEELRIEFTRRYPENLLIETHECDTSVSKAGNNEYRYAIAYISDNSKIEEIREFVENFGLE